MHACVHSLIQLSVNACICIYIYICISDSPPWTHSQSTERRTGWMDGCTHPLTHARAINITTPHNTTYVYVYTNNTGGGNTRAALAPSRIARTLRLTDVAWAAPPQPNTANPPPPSSSSSTKQQQQKKQKLRKQKQSCTTPAEHALRLSLLEPLVAFLVGDVALPVLRAAFFVTEADGTGACVRAGAFGVCLCVCGWVCLCVPVCLRRCYNCCRCWGKGPSKKYKGGG
jgi:hypothetical protein